MPTPLRTAPIVQKSALDGTKSLIHGFRFSGIRYWARHNLAHTAGCPALFGPADPSKYLAGFELDNTDHLPGRTALLNQLEQETRITVLPLPPI